MDFKKIFFCTEIDLFVLENISFSMGVRDSTLQAGKTNN